MYIESVVLADSLRRRTILKTIWICFFLKILILIFVNTAVAENGVSVFVRLSYRYQINFGGFSLPVGEELGSCNATRDEYSRKILLRDDEKLLIVLMNIFKEKLLVEEREKRHLSLDRF